MCLHLLSILSRVCLCLYLGEADNDQVEIQKPSRLPGISGPKWSRVRVKVSLFMMLWEDALRAPLSDSS